MTAEDWIDHLSLLPHPEGGFYKETYREASDGGGRAASTAIYFLLRAQDISHFHRIDADEVWHFYAGDPLNVHVLTSAGEHQIHHLGGDPMTGQVMQAVVPKSHWFGAEVVAGGQFALVGCTVAPGFEFAGFEMANRAALKERFPVHAEIIDKLTKA